MTYDSGNYEAATARAKELFGYDELRAEQKQRRESGDPVQLGIGVSTFTEMCGLAPSRVLGQLSYGAGGWESAAIRMLPTGKVEVITGTSPHGQGHETAWSQIVADRLGVPFDDVEVLHGDTAIAYWVVEKKHVGEFLGIPPTNKWVTLRGSSLAVFRDGVIVESRDHWDVQDLVQQLTGNPSRPV